jgi:hypothetical protein
MTAALAQAMTRMVPAGTALSQPEVIVITFESSATTWWACNRWSGCCPR